MRGPDASELLFDGGRVKTAAGNALVCAWSEGLRHGATKNGYHGGVSAQEVVVPLSVFTPRNMVLKGWQIALAQQLGMPAMRISGFVNAAKRVLSVDQAAVLVLDETAATVELNRELPARQFRVTVR